MESELLFTLEGRGPETSSDFPEATQWSEMRPSTFFFYSEWRLLDGLGPQSVSVVASCKDPWEEGPLRSPSKRGLGAEVTGGETLAQPRILSQGD